MYDMKHLEKLSKFKELTPSAWEAFEKLDNSALAEGEIPQKQKELIAIAVAHTTQCPYCIEIHTGKARKAGASDQEIAEAIMISAALRAGAAVVHGAHCFK